MLANIEDSVALRVFHHADLVDRSDVARREVQRDVALVLGHPNAARLDVHVLPTLRLDVGVRDVLRLQLALTGDVALRHDGKSFGKGAKLGGKLVGCQAQLASDCISGPECPEAAHQFGAKLA